MDKADKKQMNGNVSTPIIKGRISESIKSNGIKWRKLSDFSDFVIIIVFKFQ